MEILYGIVDTYFWARDILLPFTLLSQCLCIALPQHVSRAHVLSSTCKSSMQTQHVKSCAYVAWCRGVGGVVAVGFVGLTLTQFRGACSEPAFLFNRNLFGVFWENED
jgi:hypothetical protein